MIRDERSDQARREDEALRAALRRASLDAPQVDLWPGLAAEAAAIAAGQAGRRRRFVAFRRARALLAATLTLALLAGLLGGAWHLFSRRAAVGVPTRGEVGDLLILLDNRAGDDPGVGSATAYRPLAATREALLDGVVGAPIVAPDGRQVFFLTTRRAGDAVSVALTARGDDALAQQWTVPLATQSAEEARRLPYVFRIAVAAERVFVVAYRWQSADPLLVRGLDRASGAERERWAVESAGTAIDEVGLYIAPNERRLHLVAALVAAGGTATGRREIYVGFDLPDGRQERRALASGSATAFLYEQGATGQASRIAPDGRTLYRLTYDGQLHFFDLATGTAPTTLPAPFQPVPGEALLPLGQVPSHDGRRLYIVAPTRGEVAIIDLPGRRVERLVSLRLPAAAPAPGLGARLWGAARGLLVQGAAANSNLTAAPQLSPDGRWLYATGATGNGPQARVGGIWVIDTADWRVADHWQPGATFSRLLLGGDGRYLYAQEGDRLRAFDTAARREVFDTAVPSGGTYSLAELYRDRYGRSPAVAGQRPRD